MVQGDINLNERLEDLAKKNISVSVRMAYDSYEMKEIASGRQKIFLQTLKDKRLYMVFHHVEQDVIISVKDFRIENCSLVNRVYPRIIARMEQTPEADKESEPIFLNFNEECDTLYSFSYGEKVHTIFQDKNLQCNIHASTLLDNFLKS